MGTQTETADAVYLWTAYVRKMNPLVLKPLLTEVLPPNSQVGGILTEGEGALSSPVRRAG